MDRSQFDKWFAEEQHQVTQDRKQRILAKTQPQPPQQQWPRAGSQQGSRTNTPQYIQRQLNPSPMFSPPPRLPSYETTTTQAKSMEMSGESKLADIGAPVAIAPIFRSNLRGLRLTEGTDAILQCNIVGEPKPKV